MDGEPRIRPTVRVLLIDPDERVLLFRSVSSDGVVFWFPTGGGIEPGESAQEAAVREVEEETGLADVELGPEIWHRRHVLDFRDEVIDVRERWFVAHVAAFELSQAGWTDVEREVLTAYRWWSLDELSGTSDLLSPRSLAERLRDLFTEGPPKKPFDVGI